jgi:hypothetical protein
MTAPWTWGGRDGVASGPNASGTLSQLIRADGTGGVTR